MKRRFKRILLALPGFAALCRLLTRRHVRTLLYHRFAAGPDADPRRLPLPQLRRQLAAIVARHAVWTGDDHARALAGEAPWARCPVVVTVDDGYRDLYEVAFPAFREARIPAMVFLTTGFVDGTVWFWWDRLETMLAAARPGRRQVTFAGRRLDLDLTGAGGRHAAWSRLADRCRFLPDDTKETALADLARQLEAPPPPEPPDSCRPVSWQEVREMRAGGLRFGAHTVHHPILSRVAAERARAEMRDSRARLEEVLGEPVAWFCYPQGGPADTTPRVRALVRELGFRGSYIAYQDPARERDLGALPRYGVGADWTDFRWMLCGAEHLLLRLRRRLGLPVGPGRSYWAGSEPADRAAATATAGAAGQEAR